MSRRPRRNHSPAFKAKEAIAALKGDKTLAAQYKQFVLHQNQIIDWKNQLQGKAVEAFGGAEPEIDIKSLHAKIRQITLENDFLEGALNRAGLLGARK